MEIRRRWAAVASVVVAIAIAPPAAGEPAVDVAWRSRPDVAGVAVDRSGRVYTVATVSGHGLDRAVVRAYRLDGSLRWERIWRPSGTEVHGWDVAVGAGGSVIVAGSIKQNEGPATCDEIWSWGWAIRAWAPDGTVLWQRLQPGWEICDVFGTSGRSVDAAGSTVAMGVSYGHEYGAWGYVLAFDGDGRLRWRRSIDPPGSVNESVAGVAVGAGGAVYVAASRNLGALDEPERDQDAILVKLAPDGRVRWIRAAPDRSPRGDDDADRGTSVSIGRRGVSFAAILGESGTGNRGWLARYGWGGSLHWARSVPWGSAHRWPGPIVRTAVGGPVLAAVEADADGRGTHVALRGYDGAGSVRWRVRLGPLDDRLWGPTALDAAGSAIVVVGRPAREQVWSRVWLLRG